MAEWITIEKDEKHLSREREKAKRLKKSRWWKNRISRGKCHYCNGTFPPETLTIDHVIPLSRGGKSSKGNIVPCCIECNKRKRCLTPVDMILEEHKKESI